MKHNQYNKEGKIRVFERGKELAMSKLGLQGESKLIKWEGKKGIPRRGNSMHKGRQAWEDAEYCSVLS